MKLVFVLAVCIFVVNCNAEHDKQIVRARIDSCPGCSLNRLKEVKAFIYEDVPKYENVEWKKIGGAPPELIFLNEADEEIERIELKTLDRKQCNDLLTSKGFKLKAEAQENKEL